MQRIVGRNHIITGYRDNPNGTVDLRVEWVKLPPRPPQGKRERLRRLKQILGPCGYDSARHRIEAE